MYEAVEAVLDQYVRPLLFTHGGNLEVVDIADGMVRFRFQGRCSGCPAADITTEELVETALREHLPDIKGAVLVQSVSEDLLDQARALLGGRHGG